MNEAIDVEHRALAVVDDPPQQQNVALFGTSDPVAIIGQATRVADALKAVVVKKNLVSMIQGKEYPQVEAWQTLAVMLGLAAVCEWTRPVDNGWEARVIVQRNGFTIAAAEAQCLRTERSKKSWEDYAIRSMAQTRATSKSLRSVLGFVMVLAGYEATPAEEMPDKSASATTPPPPSVDLDPPVAPGSPELKALEEACIGLSEEAVIEALHGATESRAVVPAQVPQSMARAAWKALVRAKKAMADVPPTPARSSGETQPTKATRERTMSGDAGPDVPLPLPGVHEDAGGPSAEQAPHSAPESDRDTAHRALFAFCKKEMVGEIPRHAIAKRAFGAESTKGLDGSSLRRLKDLCGMWIVEGRPTSDEMDEFLASVEMFG